MPAAIQVAEWIVRYRAENLAAPVDPMSLEKLVYYAQCFYLVRTGSALFEDEIRAWRFGPVIKAVYDAYARFNANPIILPEGNWPQLTSLIQDHLEEVINFFGQLTAIELSSATHAEEPWTRARHNYSRREKSNELMPVAYLKQYYCALVSDGEEALSKHELLDVVPEPRWGTYYIAGICARRMIHHPLYDIEMAKRLSEPVPQSPELAPGFFDPAKTKDYVDIGAVSGLTTEEIMKRLSEEAEKDAAPAHTQGSTAAPKRP